MWSIFSIITLFLSTMTVDHCPHRHSYFKNKTVCLPANQTFVFIQTSPVIQKPQVSKPKVIVRPQHRTIFIGSKPRHSIPKAKTRNQILAESKAKIRYDVYKIDERKR